MKMCAAPGCTRPAMEGFERCSKCVGVPFIVCARGRRPRRPSSAVIPPLQLALFERSHKR
jgi:hypothetical protein